MNDIYTLVNSLFEKAIILNDMNTQFLGSIDFGELSTSQKLELLSKNTQYHQGVLEIIQKIVIDLDKTSVLLSSEQQELLNNFRNLSLLNKSKLLSLLSVWKNVSFVPKNLSTCPLCGGKLLWDGDNNKGCKKVKLQIGNKIYGYTVLCQERGDLE